jgi:hypothetical protein
VCVPEANVSEAPKPTSTVPLLFNGRLLKGSVPALVLMNIPALLNAGQPPL